MKHDNGALPAVAIVIATGLGLLIALLDRASLFGDDSAQFTVFLWLLCSGLLGFARPRRPWLWAVLIGPWLSLTNLVLHVLGQPGSVHPNAYTTILILLPISLAVCSVGAYGGALVRRALMPLSPSPDPSVGAGTR
jgi:hypothetical protein